MSQPTASRRTKWDVLIAVLSIVAAVAIFAVVWSSVVPLLSGVFTWTVSISSIFAPPGSVVEVIHYSSGSISAGFALRVVALSLLFAAPFLGISARTIGRGGRIASRIVGVLVLALTIPPAFVSLPDSAGGLTAGTVLILAGTALTGVLLLFLGYTLFRRASKTGFASSRMFGVLAALSGICLASIVLIPVGVILLIPVYATLPVLRPENP